MKILIIGGNRFFGKKLASKLLHAGHSVTLLNRGNFDDGFGDAVSRIRCDRTNLESLRGGVAKGYWDIIYDQVCFDAREAQGAVDVFRDKTSHYIFTSSQSVYSLGSEITEQAFNPRTHTYFEIAERYKAYAEAKRQCESTFFKADNFPVTAVRLPLVLGRDDYTKRMQFHVERVKKSDEIYFPNIDAQISLISSDDAAMALEFLATVKPAGAVNAASTEPIALSEFMRQISLVVGRQPVFASAANDKNHSPYGVESNWFMDVKKLSSLGFMAQSIQSWLREEIAAINREL